MSAGTLLKLVGRTPLIELRGFDVPAGVRLFAKLEGQNPTGSVKDRIVAHMLEHAVADGRLTPGGTVVEASTGNTAIALAMLGRRQGFRVRVVMPENVFPEIPRALAVYGADCHWVPGESGVKAAIEVAKRLAAAEGAFFLDQFGNAANPRAHYETTGPEILADLDRVDVFVAGLGTGGTLMGVGRRLKEANRETKVIAVEPHPGNLLQGLKSLADGFLPPILNLDALDGKILVRGGDAFRATRLLLEREGVFAGVSSGAVLHAALRWAARMSKGNVVMIFADAGWKYLATPCFAQQPALVGAEADDESLDEVIWW